MKLPWQLKNLYLRVWLLVYKYYLDIENVLVLAKLISINTEIQKDDIH